MIRTQEATGKTVDEARAKACALLGVQADDLNVSYEVLEMPQKTGFLGLRDTPAKGRGGVGGAAAPAAPGWVWPTASRPQRSTSRGNISTGPFGTPPATS